MSPILGYHIIFGAYGFWLPNDPRGSWSEFVGSWELLRHGPATKTDVRHSVAKAPHDPQERAKAKAALKYPAVRFTELQVRAVGQRFARYVERSGLAVWACAILPDHVHLVFGPHRLSAELIVVQLKGDATGALCDQNLHPHAMFAKSGERPPKCWSRGEWKVFLHTPEYVRRSIAYVENNPVKERLPRQTWPFVVPYFA